MELKVQEAENQGTKVPLTAPIAYPEPTPSGSGKSYPKAKGKSKGKPYSKGHSNASASQAWQGVLDEAVEEYQLIHEEEIIRDMMATPDVSHLENHPDVSHLETRMLHMENALSQVIAHLERLNMQGSGAKRSEAQG